MGVIFDLYRGLTECRANTSCFDANITHFMENVESCRSDTEGTSKAIFDCLTDESRPVRFTFSRLDTFKIKDVLKYPPEFQREHISTYYRDEIAKQKEKARIIRKLAKQRESEMQETINSFCMTQYGILDWQCVNMVRSGNWNQ